MENPAIARTPSELRADSTESCRLIRLCCAVLLFLMTALSAISQGQMREQAKPAGSEAMPEPAMPAILAAFDKYEIVAMPEAHGMKDVDDFILSLIRNPTFSEKVNDIAVECGNSLYQPILDRYIAGADVPFTEVRKVWRNTTQTMCGTSGFFEQFFPLVRAINQKLPPGRHLRVLAADPPIDWDHVKTSEDAMKFFDREPSIVSVMEKEVLSKHRKALMLFGTFHLLHGHGEGEGDREAVSIYERDYPNLTFVISDLGTFEADLVDLSSSPLGTWPVPSLARTKGTWLGALYLDHFFPPGITVDQDCNASSEFPKSLQKPVSDLVDALLYLGPQNLRLNEQMPADVALDLDYRMELQRRQTLTGFPGAATATLKDLNEEIVNSAETPVYIVDTPPDLKQVKQSCLDLKKDRSTPQ